MKIIKTYREFNEKVLRIRESMSEQEMVNIIQDGKKIYVKYINGYPEHDKNLSYNPVDINGDEVSLEIDGDIYTTKLDWVYGIDEMNYYEVEPHMTEPLADPKKSIDNLWKTDNDFVELLKDQGGVKSVIKKMKRKYNLDYSKCKNEEELFQALKKDGMI